MTAGLLSQLVSYEPEILSLVSRLRWHRLSTPPFSKWPQLLTDETWNRLHGRLETLARTLRSRPAASTLARVIQDRP